MKTPIADLHCDLLCYLEGDTANSAHDARARCSIPQLKKGNVKFQTLAIFAELGPETLRKGLAQFEIFCRLPELYPEHFIHAMSPSLSEDKITLQVAFEGASTFCSESEPIDKGLERLIKLINRAKPLYISLTWNEENRFGGGAHSTVGLKEDGQRLLEALHNTGVAVDLSHTSDALAWGILNHIDKKKLHIKVLASHSNYRSITDVPRNLPDELVKEILYRKGLIGINIYKKFIGESYLDVIKHLEHGLKLGGEDHIALGTDFFFDGDLPPAYQHAEETLFFPELSDASCYGTLLDAFRTHLGLSEAAIQKIAHRNVTRFLASK